MPSVQSLVLPFALASLLAVRGLRKRSLSPSGALAAFTVGFLLMSVPLRVFGVTMIVFYLAGSRVTKVGFSVKKKLSEEGDEEAGYRNIWQVLANSFTAVVAATLWAVLLYPDSLHALLFRPVYSAPLVYDSAFRIHWCPLPTTPPPSSYSIVPISRALIFAMLGHFACCAGDTFASELGILARSPPRLVTAPWRTVPPGTNGGMSLIGTVASLVGGVLIGVTVAVDLWLERANCLVSQQTFALQLLSLGIYGGAAGTFGSFVDSLLGATVQRSVYSKSSKMILKDGTLVPGAEVSVISGLDILSNNQVNFVASLATSIILAALAFDGRI